MIHVTKLYPTQDATVFHAFGRVISGTCKLRERRDKGARERKRESKGEEERERGAGEGGREVGWGWRGRGEREWEGGRDG